MGDGDRAASCNLFLKLGDDTAIAAQHVAKSDRLKQCCRVLGLQGLTYHLGQPLGGTHHIGRVDGLVG